METMGLQKNGIIWGEEEEDVLNSLASGQGF